jgi:hypothetical protein
MYLRLSGDEAKRGWRNTDNEGFHTRRMVNEIGWNG